MIQSLTVRNLKVIREAHVSLKPLTVIVGPNGSGKTTILQALKCFTEILSPGHLWRGKIMPPWHDFMRFAQSKISHGHLALDSLGFSEGEPFGASISYIKGQGISLDFLHTGKEDPYYSGLPSHPDYHKFEYPSKIFRLDTRKLAEPSYPKVMTLTLPEDGEGLSSILAGLYLEHPDRFAEIVRQLKNIIPGVKGLSVKRTVLELSSGVGFEVIFEMNGAHDISASEASDGTLLALGLLTAIVAQDSPQLVLIDDLERGLHPRAIQDLIVQLRHFQERNPKLQIIATSHSPYLLDFLQPEEVLLTSIDSSGYSWVKSLSEHPDFSRWKDLMAPGEFWGTVGEDWITKEKKATD